MSPPTFRWLSPPLYKTFVLSLVSTIFGSIISLQKRGGCFDQCVWLPQLHYMTITCANYSSTTFYYRSIVQWDYVPDFLCEFIISRDIVVYNLRYRKLFLTDIPHISWEVVMLQLRYKVNLKITSHFALYTRTGYNHVMQLR